MGEVNMNNIEQEATRKAIEILSKLGHIPPDRVDILIVAHTFCLRLIHTHFCGKSCIYLLLMKRH